MCPSNLRLLIVATTCLGLHNTHSCFFNEWILINQMLKLLFDHTCVRQFRNAFQWAGLLSDRLAFNDRQKQAFSVTWTQKFCVIKRASVRAFDLAR